VPGKDGVIAKLFFIGFSLYGDGVPLHQLFMLSVYVHIAQPFSFFNRIRFYDYSTDIWHLF
jgi:hypothetical protein